MSLLECINHASTAITGFGKGSGKTTLLSYLLQLARRSGPCAIVTIGAENYSAQVAAKLPTRIPVEAGDIVVTSLPYAKASGARFEILDTVAGRVQAGRLIIGRALRPGLVSLLGTEHLSNLKQALATIRQEQWAQSILIDGAVNRLTQVCSLGHLQFIYTVQIDRGNLRQVVAKLQLLNALSKLPVWPPSPGSQQQNEETEGLNTIHLNGPLTSSVLERTVRSDNLHRLQALTVTDFSKVFLSLKELNRLQVSVPLYIHVPFRLIGIAVVVRDLTPQELNQALGPGFQVPLLFNPFQTPAQALN